MCFNLPNVSMSTHSAYLYIFVSTHPSSIKAHYTLIEDSPNTLAYSNNSFQILTLESYTVR